MGARVGRYETLRAIASGGMATVHLARALGAGGFERLVAIKVMHPHIATDPEFVAMFLDEARLAARVRHPNVVATIDVQEDPLFLVMEYIEGPSLHLVLRDRRKLKQPLPIDVTLRIFLDMLAGLHAAHELTGPDGELLQLVHRDVTPQNILVGVDGIARITDFGVARAESRLSSTRGGQLKGKLAYMAPEQIKAETSDRRCDLYAAGAVLWEILTNQKLFKADNDGAIVAHVLAGVKTSPREVFAEVPEAIDAVCMRALKYAPAERFATAAEFADALEDAAEAAHIRIASSRVVAALAKQLASHDAPIPPTADSSPRSKPQASLSSSGVGQMVPAPPSSISGVGAVSAPANPLAIGSGTGSGMLAGPSVSSTNVEAVMSTPPPAGPRWRGAALVSGSLALLVGGAVMFSMRGGDPEPAGGVSGTTAAQAAAAVESLAPVTPPPPPPPTLAATAAAAPSTSAAASATTVAVAARTPPTPATGAARPAHTVTGPPPGKTDKTDKPAPSPTSFRPSDL